MANYDRIDALARLERDGTDNLEPEAAYDLVLFATGERQQAEAAMQQRLLAQQWEVIRNG